MGRGTSKAGGTGMVELVGTEKQVEWAKKIRETYIDMMKKEADYLQAVKKSGSIQTVEHNATASVFVNIYHPTATYESVEKDMKNTDIYKAFRSTTSGTPERKEAGKAFRSAVAQEALRRLNKEVEIKKKEKSAAKWIEERVR